jgi:inactive STAND
VKAPSSELYQLCRELLLECEQFENFRRLRAFCCTDSLGFIQFKLKDGSNPLELFDLNFDILIKAEHRSDGWVFPIFLRALRDCQHPDDILWTKLDDLCTKVEAWRKECQTYQKKLSESEEKELFDLLIDINFTDQETAIVNIFNNPMINKNIAAFLIDGKEKFGQEALVARLLKNIPELKNKRKIKIPLSGTRDIYNLWNEVARDLVGDRSCSAWLSEEEIISKIFEVLQNENLIFIITIEKIKEEYIKLVPKLYSELIQQFWQPIVEKMNQKETYLVMFLVDNQGYIRESGVRLAGQIDDPEYPNIPLSLPTIKKIQNTEIAAWLQEAVKFRVGREHLSSLSIEALLPNSEEGVPEIIYEKICNQCGCNWQGVLAQWLIQIQ